MLVEEYRLHAQLFGSGRFIAFPIFTAVLVAGGIYLLDLTGTPLGTIIAGIHALVFFFGLQVGTIGLVGRDAMRDVLGDVTLLVFSARTLPVSRRRLLGTFILKDIVYYALFFLTPVVVGFLPVAFTGGLGFGQIGLLWLTTTATFALGAAASLALAGIGTRSKLALVAMLAGIGVAVVAAPHEAIALTPYAVYTDPSVTSLLTSTAVLAVLLVAGPVLFDPSTSSSLRRRGPDCYRQLCRFGGGFTARPMLEVSRSSGSVWKVAFSLGVLFAVAALLLDRLIVATAIEPSSGIAFGTLLGLGTFTTYNWVTQFDDKREYLRYPVSMSVVFRGKLLAFLLFSIPVGLGYLALGGIWYPVADLLLGVAVFPLVSLYVFGVTAYLTGLSPNELLFDTPLFALYGFALAVLAVPLLVAALAYGTYPRGALLVTGSLSVGGAVVGLVLTRRAGPRWHDRLRTK